MRGATHTGRGEQPATVNFVKGVARHAQMNTRALEPADRGSARRECARVVASGHVGEPCQAATVNDTSGLRVRVHRGSHEVGGSCVEIQAYGSRLVLDVGRPLWADRDEHVPVPGIPGLTSGDDPSLLGVLVTHAHLDHYGLVDQVHPDVPVYVGEAASRIIEAVGFFTGGPALHARGFLVDRVPVELGPFAVTP